MSTEQSFFQINKQTTQLN